MIAEQNQRSKMPKNKYLHTAWFETAQQKDLYEIVQMPLQKLQIQFNAYGIINQQKYFNKHFPMVKALFDIIREKDKQFLQFKFKFIGWEAINPQCIIQTIAVSIKTKALGLNLSNIRGGKMLFDTLLNQIYQKLKFDALTLNLSYWKQDYQTFKILFSKFLVNDCGKLILEFTGWGKDINKFFKLDPQKQGYQALKKQRIDGFHQDLQRYFSQQLSKSVQEQLRLDFRNWHADFDMARLKAKVNMFVKEGTQVQSLISRNKTDKPIFKVTLVI